MQHTVQAAPRFAGSQPIEGTNPTSYLGDLIQIIGDEIGAIQASSEKLAQLINNIYKQFPSVPCCCVKIQILAHSQGTMVFRRAWGFLSPEVRKVIYFTGIGGETTIQGNYGLAGEENYAAYSNFIERDWIPVLGGWINPVRVPTWMFTGIPRYKLIAPPSASLQEHTWDPNYLTLINSLRADGPCIPLGK